jgi:hypothetical protein
MRREVFRCPFSLYSTLILLCRQTLTTSERHLQPRIAVMSDALQNGSWQQMKIALLACLIIASALVDFSLIRDASKVRKVQKYKPLRPFDESYCEFTFEISQLRSHESCFSPNEPGLSTQLTC